MRGSFPHGCSSRKIIRWLCEKYTSIHFYEAAVPHGQIATAARALHQVWKTGSEDLSVREGMINSVQLNGQILTTRKKSFLTHAGLSYSNFELIHRAGLRRMKGL